MDELGFTRSLRSSATGRLPKDVYVASRYGPLIEGLGTGSERLVRSQFRSDVERGQPLPDDPAATCQDLQALTFDDDIFDVVVTEDVLEHVRAPDAAFSEIARVLRPGGCHIFTVPMTLSQSTLTRVDTSGSSDVLLMEPEWHGDGEGRILSYRTFGYDIFRHLGEFGFDTSIRMASYEDRRRGIYDAWVLISRLAGS